MMDAASLGGRVLEQPLPRGCVEGELLQAGRAEWRFKLLHLELLSRSAAVGLAKRPLAARRFSGPSVAALDAIYSTAIL